MATRTAEEIYERYVRTLPAPERLRLLAMVAGDLAPKSASRTGQPLRSVMELHGLGREIWKDVDPDAYVDQLRDEWDQLEA